MQRDAGDDNAFLDNHIRPRPLNGAIGPGEMLQ